MEQSILTSTKKILGVSANYTAFDLDIITHINSVFSTLNQLGVGPANGFMIEDSSAIWSDLELPQNQLSMVRAYMFLKVRMLFDPPSTSFHIEAMENQIREHEFRLSLFHESTLGPEVDIF
jgi:hypothetical protein